MQQEVGSGHSAWSREESLYGRVPGEITMHGGAIVPCNGFVKGSRNVNEPLVLEVPGLGREVSVVPSCHEAGLIEYSKKLFADVPKRLDDTWFDPFASSGRVVS